MSDQKVHQSNKSEYQIRIDGKPVAYPMAIGLTEIDEWLKLCKENPDCYVDIVTIHTEVVMSQYNYFRMQKHFEANKLNNENKCTEYD